MSLFQAISLPCPACGEATAFQEVHSVNADRRPDLRQEILDGAFQQEPCPKCQEVFRLQPQFTYLDTGRGQWIAAFPYEKLAEWESAEHQARGAFARGFGELSSPAAQDLGKDLKPRLTFGWPALAEKILLREHNLDDATLELLKITIIRGMEESPLNNLTELRLTAVEGEMFRMDWLVTATEEVVQRMGVPKELYDDIVADPETWAAIRADLTAGFFVDMQRLLIESRAPAAT